MFYFSPSLAKSTLNHDSSMSREQPQKWTFENTGSKYGVPTKYFTMTAKTDNDKNLDED